jgi:hypothetical protein
MHKVLVFCEYASLNGGERSLLTALEHGVGDRIGIQVAAPSRGPVADSLQTLGIPHLPLDLHEPDGCRYPLEDCRCRVGELIAGTAAQLIHANSLSMSRICGPVAAEM